MHNVKSHIIVLLYKTWLHCQSMYETRNIVKECETTCDVMETGFKNDFYGERMKVSHETFSKSCGKK